MMAITETNRLVDSLNKTSFKFLRPIFNFKFLAYQM
jgi:hypothetical protein